MVGKVSAIDYEATWYYPKEQDGEGRGLLRVGVRLQCLVTTGGSTTL